MVPLAISQAVLFPKKGPEREGREGGDKKAQEGLCVVGDVCTHVCADYVDAMQQKQGTRSRVAHNVAGFNRK